jgi:hypothetical protein
LSLELSLITWNLILPARDHGQRGRGTFTALAENVPFAEIEAAFARR